MQGKSARELKKFILKNFKETKAGAYDHLTPTQQLYVASGLFSVENGVAPKRKADQENSVALAQTIATSKSSEKENADQKGSKRPKLFDATNKEFQQSLVESISQELNKFKTDV